MFHFHRDLEAFLGINLEIPHNHIQNSPQTLDVSLDERTGGHSKFGNIYGRFPISSNTLIIRTPLILKSPPENCSISSNSPLVFFKLIFK